MSGVEGGVKELVIIFYIMFLNGVQKLSCFVEIAPWGIAGSKSFKLVNSQCLDVNSIAYLRHIELFDSI